MTAASHQAVGGFTTLRWFLGPVLGLALACDKGPAPTNMPEGDAVERAGATESRPGAEQSGAIDAETLAPKIDAYVAAFGKHWGEAYRFSGFVMLAQHGEPVYARGFGQANRDKGVDNGPDTTFRIGSVTKQFTATAILKLQEQGKLSVRDTVRKHLPDYPETGDEITIHHLLTHTAGIPSYTDDPQWLEKGQAHEHSVEQLLGLFKDKPLAFEPGERFAYSNSGYVLLGAIVEAASGQSYAEYLQEHVLAPAGLERTFYGDGDGGAEGYKVAPDETVVLADPVHMSTPFAAGALRSTANDLLKWDLALRSGKVLSEESLAAMYTPEQQNYAYGWVVSEPFGHIRIAHSGGINGFGTHYARFPEDEVVVVVWTNYQQFNADQLGGAVAMLTFGKDPPLPKETPPVPVDANVRKRLAGGYLLDETGHKAMLAAGIPAGIVEQYAVLTLEHRDDRLYFKPIGQPAELLHGAEDGSLFIKSAHVVTLSYEAGADKDDKIEKITARSGGLELEFTRDDAATRRARAKAKTGDNKPKAKKNKG